jgi:superoxide dismutase
MSVEATDQNNTKSNSLAASNIHYREHVKTHITQENNRIAVIGEYSEQKDTLQSAMAGEAHESISAAAGCTLLR